MGTQRVVDSAIWHGAANLYLAPFSATQVEAVDVEHVTQLAHEATKDVHQAGAHERHRMPHALLRRPAARLEPHRGE